MSEFGQRLKAIRKDIQLTQAELAEKLIRTIVGGGFRPRKRP